MAQPAVTPTQPDEAQLVAQGHAVRESYLAWLDAVNSKNAAKVARRFAVPFQSDVEFSGKCGRTFTTGQTVNAKQVMGFAKCIIAQHSTNLYFAVQYRRYNRGSWTIDTGEETMTVSSTTMNISGVSGYYLDQITGGPGFEAELGGTIYIYGKKVFGKTTKVDLKQTRENFLTGDQSPSPDKKTLTAMKKNGKPVTRLVALVIDSRGAVTYAGLVESQVSEFQGYNKIIIDAALKWTFKPFDVDGRAMPVEAVAIFQWNP
jgi:hypothetical protein